MILSDIPIYIFMNHLYLNGDLNISLVNASWITFLACNLLHNKVDLHVLNILLLVIGYSFGKRKFYFISKWTELIIFSNHLSSKFVRFWNVYKYLLSFRLHLTDDIEKLWVLNEYCQTFSESISSLSFNHINWCSAHHQMGHSHK